MVGGFCLHFVNGYMFEVFPDETAASAGEYWRLFKLGEDESHFVFPEE